MLSVEDEDKFVGDRIHLWYKSFEVNEKNGPDVI